MSILIGILALQGDFSEHKNKLEALDSQCKTCLVRYPEQLADLDALVIPGGESTTIAKLTDEGTAPIFGAIQKRIGEGMPVWGTCMGSIFLAKEIEGSSQGRLAAMDLKVRRNAFGPQRHSFEVDLPIKFDGLEDSKNPYPCVFIRAPLFLTVGEKVEVLCTLPPSAGAFASGIVMARQDNLLVTAFHPELTSDSRVHKYFLDMVTAKTLTTVSATVSPTVSPTVKQSPKASVKSSAPAPVR